MTDKVNSPLKDALCKFKKKKCVIVKGKENPFFKSKYADLAIILEAIEEGLADVGVVTYTRSTCLDGSWQAITTITHKDSDEKLESSFPLFGNKPQEFGSSFTYARRYNILALLNLSAEDDDGNATQNAKPIKQEPKMLTGKEFLEVQEKIRQVEDGMEFEKVKKEAKSLWPRMLKDQQSGIVKAIQIKEEEFDTIPNFDGK